MLQLVLQILVLTNGKYVIGARNDKAITKQLREDTIIIIIRSTQYACALNRVFVTAGCFKHYILYLLTSKFRIIKSLFLERSV